MSPASGSESLLRNLPLKAKYVFTSIMVFGILCIYLPAVSRFMNLFLTSPNRFSLTQGATK